MANYVPFDWQNGVGGGTPITAENLDNMEAGIAGSLQRSGGTMSGELTLSGDGSAALHPASKQQLDAHAALGNTVHGGTALATADTLMRRATGGVTEVGTPTASLHAANKSYVDGKTGLAVYRRTAVQSIPDATQTQLTWTSEAVDTITASLSGGVVTLSNAGLYLFNVHVTWDTNNAGIRRVWLKLGGAEVVVDSMYPSTGSVLNETQRLTWIAQMSAGWTVEVDVRQNSGGALNVRGEAAAGPFQSALQIARIA